jgi:hypothetical protein
MTRKQKMLQRLKECKAKMKNYIKQQETLDPNSREYEIVCDQLDYLQCEIGDLESCIAEIDYLNGEY